MDRVLCSRSHLRVEFARAIVVVRECDLYLEYPKASATQALPESDRFGVLLGGGDPNGHGPAGVLQLVVRLGHEHHVPQR
ncbi:hypothetical protein NDU88_003172 [Pleurodeles waltl]|uniref:FHA domain-containing protein n=1 Tax=Pleurodeles waltl TaxID=8319 RepID=A0AAV7W5F0_PLEWA|nr:hypothetical protein NDU88_003172 [Pleurodeles waltl]